MIQDLNQHQFIWYAPGTVQAVSTCDMSGAFSILRKKEP